MYACPGRVRGRSTAEEVGPAADCTRPRRAVLHSAVQHSAIRGWSPQLRGDEDEEQAASASARVRRVRMQVCPKRQSASECFSGINV